MFCSHRVGWILLLNHIVVNRLDKFGDDDDFGFVEVLNDQNPSGLTKLGLFDTCAEGNETCFLWCFGVSVCKFDNVRYKKFVSVSSKNTGGLYTIGKS